MDLNPKNFLSINEILADVLVGMEDEGTTLLTPGFYRSQVKLALDELQFDIDFFQVPPVDIEINSDLIFEVPKGCYNLKEIYGYAGKPSAVDYIVNIYWKKGFTTRGKGTGYTANVPQYVREDPFIRCATWTHGVYFFNIQNGLIYLSDECAVFDYIRFIFSGVPSGTLDEVQMVPREVSKAVKLWVIEKCASYLKGRDGLSKYRVIQLDAAAQLDEYGMNGAWHQAKMRVRELDKKQLHDVLEYNAKMKY